MLAAQNAFVTAAGVAILEERSGRGRACNAALAVGIGSTTAIYSVVQAVLLNPLPYQNPDRFFLMFGAWPEHPDWWTLISYSDAMD